MLIRKKVGLALGSGAVRGLAHIGVIRTLLKHNIPIDYLAGSSVGAWVGAHFALYQDIDLTANLTVGNKKEKFFALLEPTIFDGIIKGEKVGALLNEWLNDHSFDDVKIPFKVAATDLISGNKVILSEGKLASAVRASMAVPGFFKPVILENKVLVDGGISDPVPVDLVRELGAEVVIAVNLDFSQEILNITPDQIGLTNIATRTLKVMRHHLAQYSCYGADFIIEPPLQIYSSWSDYFINNNDQKIIGLAEEATEKIIPKLKEMIYNQDSNI
jgi:NTE family protein